MFRRHSANKSISVYSSCWSLHPWPCCHISHSDLVMDCNQTNSLKSYHHPNTHTLTHTHKLIYVLSSSRLKEKKNLKCRTNKKMIFKYIPVWQIYSNRRNTHDNDVIFIVSPLCPTFSAHTHAQTLKCVHARTLQSAFWCADAETHCGPREQSKRSEVRKNLW